nr:hypothetical protein [uncultured Methanoregula sp.]
MSFIPKRVAYEVFMRQVVTGRNQYAIGSRPGNTAGSDTHPDTYRERLVKYIPVEIIVIYIALYGGTYALAGTDPLFVFPARWLIVAGFICTPVYLWTVEGVSDWVQLLISTLGFGIWVAALGVIPVADLPWYNQVAAAVLLPVYVFGTPLIDGIPGRF